MSEVIGVELVPLDYEARLETLPRHGVGLWDVVAEAQRPGSLNSSIRDRNYNDLLALLARYPGITAIAFNGGTAKALGLKVLGDYAARYHIHGLPSSSPAYTFLYAEKALQWQALRATLNPWLIGNQTETYYVQDRAQGLKRWNGLFRGGLW